MLKVKVEGEDKEDESVFEMKKMKWKGNVKILKNGIK